MINQFQGEYRWLSNFWPARIAHGSFVYGSVEAAYQAQKFPLEIRGQFQHMHPSEAKHVGRQAVLDKSWDERKIKVMAELLRIKFRDNPQLRTMLIATGNQKLIEGNRWGDRFWGHSPVGSNCGENHLGKLLMIIRRECQEETA